jgi:hypothetical protein
MSNRWILLYLIMTIGFKTFTLVADALLVRRFYLDSALFIEIVKQLFIF